MNSQDVLIDYELLGKAVEYYKSLGYEQIEVPWIVHKDISMVTCPHEDNAFGVDTYYNNHLIGSAEQGFLQILKNNPDLLDWNKFYFAVSPCFRNEIQDELHSFWFMKIELFVKRRNDSYHLNYQILLDHARLLFNKLLNDKVSYCLALAADETTCDLAYNGVELGSYGIRKYKNFQYLYGTGLALPRFTIVKEKNNDKKEKQVRKNH